MRIKVIENEVPKPGIFAKDAPAGAFIANVYSDKKRRLFFKAEHSFGKTWTIVCPAEINRMWCSEIPCTGPNFYNVVPVTLEFED